MPPRRQSQAPVKATRPRVYARVKPMVGADAGKSELFTITDNQLEYTKEEGTWSPQNPTAASTASG